MAEVANAPSAPIGAQARDMAKESAQFAALKRSLNNITSWELSPSGWDEGIVLKFTESSSEAQAQFLANILM